MVSSLSAQVAGLEMVAGTGEHLRATPEENPDVLEHARLGLGALGILTTITFRVEPLFVLRAAELALPWDRAVDEHEELRRRRGRPPTATPTTARTSRSSSRSSAPTTAGPTGASCTPSGATSWRRRTAGSATSSLSASGWTRSGCSPTPTSAACSATEAYTLDGPAGIGALQLRQTASSRHTRQTSAPATATTIVGRASRSPTTATAAPASAGVA